MSGTVRDKIFVGQVSRKRNARECQEWCQVKKDSTKQIHDEKYIEAEYCAYVTIFSSTLHPHQSVSVKVSDSD